MPPTKNTLKEVPQEKENGKAKEPKKKEPGSKKKENKESSPGIFSSAVAFFKNEKLHKISGTFLLLFSVYLAIAFVSHFFTWKNNFILSEVSFWRILNDPTLEIHNFTGKLGARLAYLFLNESFGASSFLFAFLFFVAGFRLAFGFSLLPVRKTAAQCFFYIIWISLFMGYILQNNELFFGYVGFHSNLWLAGVLGKPGTGLLLFFSLITFLVLVYNIPLWFKPGKKEEEIPVMPGETVIEEEGLPVKANALKEVIEEPVDLTPEEINQLNDFEVVVNEGKAKPVAKAAAEVEMTIEQPDEEIEEAVVEHKTIETAYDPTLDLSSYKYPTSDLLNDYDEGKGDINKEELEANKNRIVSTLNNYGIAIEKIKATIGPTVTLYELIPAAGVRISKIKNLEDDIALSLSALGIRIIAPIPGKGTIGIEVPNQKPEIVAMKTMLDSDRFQNTTFDLPIALGKTISNECYIADLAKMPHLLVAGATGQGKSVGLNAILASLLYKKHPSQLKFVLVDPKKVELTLYSKIERHFLAKLPDSEEAIITDTKKVVRTLNSLCIEMEQRYDLLKDAGCRTLKEYNAKFVSRKLNPDNGHKFLPYIILVVDEFADFIMTAGKEVELPIARLAQLARAVGIHLIIATQRPSVNVITGTIKANFPARIAFRVTSKVDSRTILDTGGADQLIGRGDMLLLTGSDIIRLQCPFIDTPEIEKIAEFIGEQRGYADAHHLPECAEDEGDSGSNTLDPNERDPFFEDAARLIVQHQQGSTSLIQRKMKLGYNRAGRIIDQLEAAGIVGPFEGSKAREVKVKDLITLEQILNDINGKML